MSGHVFHPGHDALHGITVVLFTSGPRTFVGRFDREESGFVVLHQADFHEGDGRDAWLAQVRRYGVPPKYPTLTVPAREITKTIPLGDLPQE